MSRPTRYVLVAPVVVATLVAVAVIGARPTQAVPNFARRYATSCATCHSSFPKLTPFGEAFRMNHYQFPGGVDEDYLREEPVLLGADAYRDVFPQAIWPGLLPAKAPLSIFGTFTAIVRPQGDPVVDLTGIGGNVVLNLSTPLGDSFAIYTGIGLIGALDGTGSIGFERMFFLASFLDTPALDLRIGLFEPSLFSFTMHRGLGLVPWILMSTVGDTARHGDPALAPRGSA